MGSFSALLSCCMLAVTHAAFLTNLAGAATRPRHPPIVCAEKPTDSAGNPIKAALSPYMHFCAERRPSLTAELKASMGADFKNTLVMSSLGAEWKKLGDGDKAKFAQVAAADKQRYDTAEFDGALAPANEIEELRWIGSSEADSVSATSALILQDLKAKGLID